ncbi:hypothetical protein SANA_29660 [Gottschalkiaceae bacterium SANA]|nr:hypothetical protein SANA_29660 [Gottschalkiaceae bacterium SANA]
MYTSLAISVIFFVLKAMGLQSLAKNQAIKKNWIAWIPFLNGWLQCKVVGSHILFGKFETKHLFAYLLAGSIATDFLFYRRTPISMGLLMVLAGFMVYLTYIMFRDFYGKYSKRASWLAVVAMICSPLHAIFVTIYSDREMRQLAAD